MYTCQKIGRPNNLKSLRSKKNNGLKEVPHRISMAEKTVTVLNFDNVLNFVINKQ
jgi:DNA-binding Xre family transcriptional regulator